MTITFTVLQIIASSFYKRLLIVFKSILLVTLVSIISFQFLIISKFQLNSQQKLVNTVGLRNSAGSIDLNSEIPQTQKTVRDCSPLSKYRKKKSSFLHSR